MSERVSLEPIWREIDRLRARCTSLESELRERQHERDRLADEQDARAVPDGGCLAREELS